ncbi:MAG: hypothetical protein M3Q31_21465 [Actinomycetota bacterium]|nr:hypothetical protein [Actinomycetota bacterium]
MYSLSGDAEATVAAVVSTVPKFHLVLDEPFAWKEPGAGVAFDVTDVEGGLEGLLAKLRRRGIAPTAHPHITVVHEATARRRPLAAEQALAEARALAGGGRIEVDHIVVMEEDASRWREQHRFPLALASQT